MQYIIGELDKYPEGYWDFKGKIKTGIHSIGKYPATMVPDMQYELLNIIIKQIKGNNIKLLDPFCGSGTILAIAQDLGINSIGIDINPYATLLSYVKTNLYNRIQSLSKIRQCIIAEEDASIRKFFWVCLSETIFKYSNDRTSTFKLHILPKDKINLIQNNCIDYFIGKVKENASFLNYEEKNKVKIIYGDCCDVMQHKLKGKFEIICTSPPYGDNSTTVTYGQSSILYLKWIDTKDLPCKPCILDKYSTIDKISIGGKRRTICNTNNIQSLSEYLNKISVNKKEKVINFFEDYCVVLKSIESCLSKDGYLIMTVGNRSIDAIRQPLDKITIEIAENLGLKIISKFNRNILYKKTPLTLSSGKNEKVVKSISEETILIFTK